MAFSSTIDSRQAVGRRMITFGSWDGTGVTSGTITTGLNRLKSCSVTDDTDTDITVAANANGKDIDLAGITAGDTGYWTAIGW